MPKDTTRKFINPLTQPSTEPETETSTKTSTEPATLTATDTSTLPSTETSTYTLANEHRKRGKEAFEQTHTRITLWIDKHLKKQFEALARRENAAKATLLNEAIADLLKKYDQP